MVYSAENWQAVLESDRAGVAAILLHEAKRDREQASANMPVWVQACRYSAPHWVWKSPSMMTCRARPGIHCQLSWPKTSPRGFTHDVVMKWGCWELSGTQMYCQQFGRKATQAHREWVSSPNHGQLCQTPSPGTACWAWLPAPETTAAWFRRLLIFRPCWNSRAVKYASV